MQSKRFVIRCLKSSGGVKSALTLLLILLPFSLSAEFQKLDWEDTPGALEYKVEIVSGETSILETITPKSELQVDLAPGVYQFRISVINKFKKEVASSEWNRITIKPKLVPVPVAAEPVFFYDYEDFSFSLLARSIEEKVEIGLIVDSGITPLTIDSREEELFKLSLPSMPKAGKYKIGIRNESGTEAVSDFEIEIKTPVPPELNEVNPVKFDISQVYLENVITGNHFEKGMTLSINGPKNAKLGEISVISSRRASFNFNPGGFPPGTYTITTQNPGHADSTNEITISLIEVKEQFDVSLYTDKNKENDGSEENTTLSGNENLQDIFNFTNDRKKSGLPSGDGKNYVDFGYQYSFLLPEENEMFSNSALGMMLKTRLNIKPGSRQTSPFLEGLGVEFILGYNLFESHTPEGYYRQLINTSLCLSYLSDLEWPVEFIGRAGLGYSLSSLFGDGPMGNRQTLSFDFNIVAGVGVRTIIESITFEAGINYMDIYFVNFEWRQLNPYFTTGVSF